MTDDETNAVQDERRNDLQTTLCDDGRHVNVRNELSGSGDVHTVSVSESGDVEGCTCRGYTYHRTCYHTDHVRHSPLLTASAQVLSKAQVVTDGGHDIDDRFRLPEDPKHVSEEEYGTVEVSRCKACSKLTTEKFCSDRCERQGEVDETPL